MSSKQVVRIPEINLDWSEWHPWELVEMIVREGGAKIPAGKPGVYEVRRRGTEERLTIGKASDLRWRVRQALVRGKGPHSSGIGIRAKEDLSTLEIRWAETDRPSAVEEELHRLYKLGYGSLPEYTKRT